MLSLFKNAYSARTQSVIMFQFRNYNKALTINRRVRKARQEKV